MSAALLLLALVAISHEGGSSEEQGQPVRDTRPAAPATGTLSGLVTTDDAQPRPLRRARVTLNSQALDMPWTAITADDGTFVFERVPPGRFTIAAAKDGYVPMAYGATRPGRPGAGIQLADRQSVRVPLRLPRGAVITGTVVGADGQPAAGVFVSALTRRLTGGPNDSVYAIAGAPSQATTDDRGVYRIYGLSAGDYLIATQPTSGPGPPSGTSGTVVQMMSRGTVSEKRMLLSQVFHPGVTEVGRASHVTVRAGEERAGIDVQLQYVPLATVTGTAISPAGFAAARVTLWRTDEQARPQSGPVATADNQGRFQFPAVAPGPYRITARMTPAGEASGGRGGFAGSVQCAVADVVVNGEDVEVALAMQPGLSMSGRVAFESDAGAPSVPPTQLRTNIGAFVAASGGGWPIPPAVVDGDRFRVEGIVPGLYRALSTVQGIRGPIGRWWLKSIVGDGRELLDAPLELAQSVDDVVVTFTDRASLISGTLTDRGVPVPELWVIVFPADRAFWFFNSRRIAAVHPSREGRWSIQNLPPGGYRITYADLDQFQWFDPAVLERLMASATPLTLAGSEQKTIDLTVR